MAMDIADFLQPDTREKIMVIEAPVGTGKSLGALVPSMVEATTLNNQIKVVYATATVNLQGQLMHSEVPLLNAFSLVKQPILAKGKTHYYCHREFEYKKGSFTNKEKDLFLSFYQKSVSGQRNELEDHFEADINDKTWERVNLKNTTTKKACEGCDYFNTCPSITHRNKFMSLENDLIITNHDQLIVSSKNRLSEFKRPSIVPTEPGIIVIDEGHHFLENFLNRLEKSISIKEINYIKNKLPKKHKEKLNFSLNKLIVHMKQRIKKEEIQGQGRYPIDEQTFVFINDIKLTINEAINEIDVQESFSRFTYLADDLDELVSTLSIFDSENYVHWVNFEDSKLCAISQTFSSEFREFITYLSRNNKVIIMSGTLTSHGDFTPILNQWRLKCNEVILKRYETPFDYQNQAIIYVPTEIEQPENDNYINSCIRQLKTLTTLTKGRSLILTTSKEHMTKISTELNQFLLDMNIKLLTQEQSGVEKLTRQFKEDESSVLVGSGSFFSGFSIPGSSLISVALTKLPFPIHDDPILKLIGEGYEDDLFNYIQYPNMINKLNQAAGRLIRDIKDYGLFTIMDPRVFSSKRYSKRVQEELEGQGYHITRSLEEVKQFIEKKLSNGSESQYQEYDKEKINISTKITKDIITKRKSVAKKVKIPNSITKAQREFAKAICLSENRSYPKGLKTSDQLYQLLINVFYYEWKDYSVVEEKFPYRNEEEKNRLLEIKGTERRIFAPLCDALGCKGSCQDKDKIEETIIEEHGATKVTFLKHKDLCRVIIDPTHILKSLYEVDIITQKK